MDAQGQGAQLGKYTLVAEIARGGMGIVYLAKALGPARFQKLVVVKQLKPELAEDEKFRGMFMDEARLAARLNHRNIVQTIAVDQDGDRHFFVMEYLEGRTLQSVARLKDDKALSVPAILRIACDVLAGLHYAHELADYDGKPLGIVHRDISAQNVFLTYDGQVKLIDFGVAKALGRDMETEVGALKGRVVCMAPEHVGGSADIDRRADVFSVGLLLRELLTGQRVWEGMSEVDVLRELLAKRIPPLTDEQKANIPDEACAVIDKAMAPERDDRYRTAHAMRAALEQYVIRIDPTGSLGKMGEHISKAFAEQRAHVRTMIEEHVARAPRRQSAHGLPTLVAAPTSSADLPVAPASSPSTSTGSSPSIPTAPRQTMSGANPVHAMEIAPPPPDVAPSFRAPAKKKSGAGFVIGAIGIVAVAAAGAALIVHQRDAKTTATATATAPAATPASSASSVGEAPAVAAAAAAPKPEMFDLNIRATPANAQLYVDDVLSQNPWRAKYVRGSSHSIRVVAPGFTPKTSQVSIDGTANIDIALDKATPVTVAAVARGAAAAPVAPVKNARPAAPQPAPQPVAAPPTPTPVATPAPADVFGGGKAPKRTVDSKSPYE